MSADRRNRQTLMTLVLLGALAAAAFAIAFYRTTDWTAPFPRDATTLAAGRDFLNSWMAGRAAYAPDPGRYYDPATYNRAVAAVVGPGYPAQTWSYPPTQLLVAAPFGLLPYRAALLLWTLLGAAALFWAARYVWREAKPAVFLFAAPAALFCLMSGQSSFFTTALLIAGLALLEKRPLAAGVLIGLLSLKPQLVLLMPVLLVAGRHWRTLASAAATTLVLAGAATVLFGVEVWRDYIAYGLPAQHQVLVDTQIIATQAMPTIFTNLHLIGLSTGIAMAVQAAFALGAGLCVFWAGRRKSDPAAMAALFFAASVSATPYLMPYDTLPLAMAGIWLLRTGNVDDAGRTLIKLVWWLPLLQTALGHFHIPGAGLIAPCLVLWVMLRLGANSAPAQEHTAPASAVN